MQSPPDPTGLDAAIAAAVRSAIEAASPEPIDSEDRLSSSISDAARRTGLSRSTLYRLMDTGQLGYVKIGARRLIPEAALVALLAEHREAA